MKVNSKLSLLFWLRGKSTDSKKDLYVRITIEGARAETALGRKVPVEKWDQSEGEMSDRTPDSLLVNRKIADTKVKLEKLYDVLELEHGVVTPEMLRDAFVGKKREKKTFIELADFFIAKFEKKVEKKIRSKASLSKWKTMRTKVKQFFNHEFKRENIDLSAIKYSFAEDFVDFMIIEQGCNTNTAFKYFKQFKQLLKTAVERGWLPSNPVQGFRSTYVHPERDILNEVQLYHLYQKDLHVKRLEEVRDCYVFMCFTGYAFKDSYLLEPENRVHYFDGEEWIIKNREKTWCRENVPLMPIAKEILDKYKNHPYCIANNKLLPFDSNQKFNAYLKEIADICGINKELTSHTARHTFATTVTLANGVPIETVSALLGHKSIKTTQIYAKIVAEKVSMDMSDLRAKLIVKMPISMMNSTDPVAA